MEIQDINKDEIIKLSATVLAVVGAEEFSKQFPDFVEWSADNISQEEQNEVVKEMITQVNDLDLVSIDKSDFISLYAHTQAILGFEETSHRFPKSRLLVLNVLTDQELESAMSLIKSIEERISLNR